MGMAFYLVYLILLVVAFAIIKFLIVKIFHKDVSKNKMGITFLIMAILPFALFKGCVSCIDHVSDEFQKERTQESYVRKFLAENEAGVLVLPKFNVKTYERESQEYDKWVIEFEEPIDNAKLEKMDPSGVSRIDGSVLLFPIVFEEMSEVVDPEEDSSWIDMVKPDVSDDEPDYKYDYRNFKLEIMPDGKTAILLYSYHITYKQRPSSGGGSHHHHHHHDD